MGHMESNTGRNPIIVVALAFLGTSILWFLAFIYSWALAEFGCQSTPADISWRGVGAVAWFQLGGRGILILANIGLIYYAYKVKSEYARQDQQNETAAMNFFLAKSGFIASLILLAVMLVETVPVFYFLNICW
jgi:hypothetical protein